MKKEMTTSDFSIGDGVQHVQRSPKQLAAARGIVISHNHARGLIRVRWESNVQEWVKPKQLMLLAKH